MTTETGTGPGTAPGAKAHGSTAPGAKAPATPDAAPTRSTHELRADATAARARLALTLDAIEYKLNVPKRLRDRERLARRRLHRLGEENPAALIGIALGSALLVGTTVWFGVKAVFDR